MFLQMLQFRLGRKDNNHFLQRSQGRGFCLCSKYRAIQKSLCYRQRWHVAALYRVAPSCRQDQLDSYCVRYHSAIALGEARVVDKNVISWFITTGEESYFDGRKFIPNGYKDNIKKEKGHNYFLLWFGTL